MVALFAALVLAPFAAALGPQDAERAKQLLDAVAATMKDAPAVAFESEVRIGVGGAGGVEVAQKAKALLQRPNLARLEISGASQDALIVLDGATAWHYLKITKRFVQSKQLGTMKLEQYGVGPAGTLFFEKGCGSLRPYLSEAVVSQEKLGDETCDVVAWKVGAEESRLWIGGNRLRRFQTTRSIAEQKFVQTFTYGAFDLAPPIAADSFTFAPPKGAKPTGAGDESGLVDVGADAPDFTATGLDGKALKLADFKGRSLLVTFWFFGCSTCREELPHLQQLNVEYAKRGVAMVAVNFGDPPETIAAYFQKEKLGLTPARQEKGEMSDAFGVRTYPTTYVIGPDGKVAWRRVGIDEESLRAALEKVTPAK